MNVMASLIAGLLVNESMFRCKYVLPAPFCTSVRVFAGQGIWHIYPSIAICQVFLMYFSDKLQVFKQWFLHYMRQHGKSITVTFANNPPEIDLTYEPLLILSDPLGHVEDIITCSASDSD